jgi:hypothetical protein
MDKRYIQISRFYVRTRRGAGNYNIESGRVFTRGFVFLRATIPGSDV